MRPVPRGEGSRSRAKSLLRAGRPKQWVMNLLVLAAPGAAGVLSRGSIMGRTSAAFASFCLVSSAMYLVNDVVDAPWDRAHPGKRFRPVAAGIVSPRLALVTAGVLLAGGAAIGGWLGWRFEACLGLYAGLTVAYSLWLREIAVLDIGVVASGFVIRAVAGSFAVHVPVSKWFLILTSFGSLLIVAGKREAPALRWVMVVLRHLPRPVFRGTHEGDVIASSSPGLTPRPFRPGFRPIP